MEQIAVYITLVLKLLPALIAAGEDVIPLLTKAYAIWVGDSKLTQADMDEVDALIKKNSAIIQAPIPEEEL